MQREILFKKIYVQGIWGEAWSSGKGSLAHTSGPYLAFLQNFLSENKIKSVVEIGCGDWQLSRHIDWSGIDYLGIDIVSEIIERNHLFSTEQIQFLRLDAICDPLPKADLILCKDVLQHLSNEEAHILLKKMTEIAPCLITNDVDPLSETSYNEDILTGEYRPIDILMPPFLVNGKKMLTYPSDKVLKQVIFWEPIQIH